MESGETQIIDKTTKSHTVYNLKADFGHSDIPETTLPKKMQAYLKDPMEKGSKNRTRFLLGPSTATVLCGSVCSSNFARNHYLHGLDITQPTREVFFFQIFLALETMNYEI